MPILTAVRLGTFFLSHSIVYLSVPVHSSSLLLPNKILPTVQPLLPQSLQARKPGPHLVNLLTLEGDTG